MRNRRQWMQWIRRTLLALVMWGGGGSPARAQAPTPPRPPLVVGAYAQGSIILAHTPAIRHLVASHPTGLELNVQRQTTGRAPWHGWYKYPKVGLALIYYDYHNPILGRSYAASVYLSKPISRTATHDFSIRLGTGLAYMSNPYSQRTNVKNNIASSALNATIQFRLEYDYALTPHLGLLLGLGLNHYSNGATAKPNLGVNLPTLTLGLNYHQQRPAPVLAGLALAPAPPDVGRTFGLLSTSLGYKQRNESDRRKYLVQSVSMVAGRRLNRKSNLLLGLEGFYDRSLVATLRDSARDQTNLPDVKKAALFVGHELLFGRLAVGSHLGFYVYNPYKSNPAYYERLGLRYQLWGRLFGALDLKIHGGKADALELRVGARL